MSINRSSVYFRCTPSKGLNCPTCWPNKVYGIFLDGEWLMDLAAADAIKAKESAKGLCLSSIHHASKNLNRIQAVHVRTL